ncbi:hypothetical protein BJY00DRAFT_73301 [Aspergillus carlsbadensis]|nr:hypothetical protein BJY00DRAFT_73301 [Aspergillus carlsbadensis]
MVQVYRTLTMHKDGRHISSPPSPSLSPSHPSPADRVRRACDKCHISRTRCNGELPCERCANQSHPCQYNRTRRKRGPKPKILEDSTKSPTGYLVTQDIETSSNPVSFKSSNEYITPTEPDYHISDTAKWNYEGQGHSVPSSQSESSAGIPPSPCTASTSPTESASSVQFSAFNQLSTNKTEHDGACRYVCLRPLLPHLQGTLSSTDACDLLEIFFSRDSDPSFTGIGNCPYVLSSVIRRKSILSAIPRRTSPALLAIILWCVSHTAYLEVFQHPGARKEIIQRLYSLCMILLKDRGGDENSEHPGMPQDYSDDGSHQPNVDDILGYILLTCVICTSDFKSEGLKWWDKAVSLTTLLGYNSEATILSYTDPSQQLSLASEETHEECRRAFWLVYILDSHLAISFNKPRRISDFECQVLIPLPEWIWQDLDRICVEDIPPRVYGPSTCVFGTGFFECFLPLSSILGSVINFHLHDQLQTNRPDEVSLSRSSIEVSLAVCEQSIDTLQMVSERSTDEQLSYTSPTPSMKYQVRLVVAYSRYIINVLRILLHDQGGYICSTIDGSDDMGKWIMSPKFLLCASNSFAAVQLLSDILEVDQNLSFVPFFFSVYLLRGTLAFLFFADRISQDPEVNEMCRNLITAYEVLEVKVDSDFQAWHHPLPIFDLV